MSAGLLSVPLVFEYNLVLLFNDLFVTTGETPYPALPFPAPFLPPSFPPSCCRRRCCADVPEAKDLETPLEVGTFAWGWMEPPLGTVSFFLLCMQFARSQLQNIGTYGH